MYGDLKKKKVELIGRNSNKEFSMPITEDKLMTYTTICNKFKQTLTDFDGESFSKKNTKMAESKESNEIEDELHPLIKNTTTIIEEDTKDKEAKYRHLIFKSHNVYDSLSDEEDDTEIDSNIDKFIKPLSTKKIMFDTTVFIVTILSIIFVPVEVFIREENKGKKNVLSYLNIFGDFVFLSDLILSFFTGFYDNSENLILDYQKIAMNYLFSWFIFDFICAIPFGTYFEIVRPKRFSSVEMLKFINFIKILKVSNNAGFQIFFIRLLSSNAGTHIVLILTVAICFLIAHVFACVYLILGVNNENSWIFSSHYETKDAFDLYIASFYFIFSTIFGVGYGDHTIANYQERLFILFLLIFGVLINSWMISSLSEYGNHDLKSIKLKILKGKISLLRDIRRTTFGKDEIFLRVERFLYYNFKQQIFNSNEIFDSIPHSLKCELIQQMYMPIINNFNFFKQFKNREFVVEVISHFIPSIAVKNDRLINQGEFIEEMIFVKNGKLSVELPLPNSIHDQLEDFRQLSILKPGTSLKSITKTLSKSFKKNIVQKFDLEYARLVEIRKNEHYGGVQMFLNQQTNLSVRVNSKVAELYLLRKTDALPISNAYPDIWKAILRNSIHNIKQVKKLIKKVLDFFYNNNEEMLKHLYLIHQLSNPINLEDSSSDNSPEEGKRPKISSNSKINNTSSSYKETYDNLITQDSKNSKANEEKSVRKIRNLQRDLLVKNSLEKKIDFYKKTLDIGNSNQIIEKIKDDSNGFIRKKSSKKYKKRSKFDPLMDSSDNEQNESGAVLLNKIDEKDSLNFSQLSEYKRINNDINDEFYPAEEDDLYEQFQNFSKRKVYLNNNNFSTPKKKVRPELQVEDFSMYINSNSKKKTSSPLIKTSTLQESFSNSPFLSPSPKLKRTSSSIVTAHKEDQRIPSPHHQGNSRKSFFLKSRGLKDKSFVSSPNLINLNFLEHSGKRRSVFGKLDKTKSSNKVLVSIESNIEDNCLNLNDPRSFYANKFSDILNTNIESRKVMSAKLDDFYSILKGLKVNK